MRSRAVAAVLAALATLAIPACGGGSSLVRSSRTTRSTTTTGPTRSSGPAAPCGTLTAAPRRYDHVVWIWMENHTADQVLGRTEAAFATGLSRRCGTAARYASVGSPSLPNYLGATSGDTHGISDDDPPAAHPVTADNLFRQVRAAGLTERSYQESMSSPCALTSSGDYAVKHNPAAYYSAPADRAACRADDVPLGSTAAGALHDDLTTGHLPAFAFVTPNLCHDTHDCPVAVGDQWLQPWVAALLASPAYAAGTTAVLLVWDEPTPLPFVAISPSVRPGAVVATPVDHYALLRTTEEMLGLPVLGHAAAAPSLRAILGL